ncbi:NAD(P)-binding protein [Auriscalpium vulgare]|uniref:NAD(P)-binding protein n=1 Tax=Auriscalpium vulgare TaxID=40419 RepID=A0ACB8S902_9AGAM|nr:NAD(P)-binding protein [Auriscalpium vulgare]
MSTWTLETTAEDAAFALRDQIRGKNVVVTGVSPKGLGAETVRVLAPYAKTIILAGRSQAKIDETIADVKKGSPSANLKSVILDLASLDSVRKAAADVNALGLPIHVIVNNAGSPQPLTLTKTVDGFETQIGTNHLGHFLFNALVFPAVLQAAKEDKDFAPRVVNVSSGAHAFGGDINFDDPWSQRMESYNRSLAYAASKTANILYTRRLAKVFKAHGVLSFSLSPGLVRSTTMGGASSDAEVQRYGLLDAQGKPTVPELWKTLGTGTSTQVIAAFDPALKDKSGAYLIDGKDADEQLAPYAKDAEKEEKLWQLSEQAVGQKFSA